MALTRRTALVVEQDSEPVDDAPGGRASWSGSWSWRVAREVVVTWDVAAVGNPQLELCSVLVRSLTDMSVTFRDARHEAVLGLTVARDDAASTSLLRLAGSSPEEVAFDLVHVGICEPRGLEDFSPPAEDGVRWLPVQAWAD